MTTAIDSNLAMIPAIDNDSNRAITTAIDTNHDNEHDHIDHFMTTTIVGFITDAHSPPPPSQQGLPGSNCTNG